MNWYQMAVFIYAGALTHFLADFLHHWMEKKKKWLLALHCLLYALTFIPLFLWLKVNLWWLVVPFLSHLLIDSQHKKLLNFVNLMLKKSEEKDTTIAIITAGIDQVLHLAVLLIVAILNF